MRPVKEPIDRLSNLDDFYRNKKKKKKEKIIHYLSFSSFNFFQN